MIYFCIQNLQIIFLIITNAILEYIILKLTILFQNANYVDIDQLYPLTQESNQAAISNYKENYSRNHSPIYQNTIETASASCQDTSPIYSNLNAERYRPHAQGMTYGETLAHQLRQSMGRSDSGPGIPLSQFSFFRLCLYKEKQAKDQS